MLGGGRSSNEARSSPGSGHASHASHCRPNGIFLHVERNLTAVIFGVFLDALVSRHVIQLSRFGP